MSAKKKLISFILFIGLLFSLFAAVYLVKQRQEIRKRAAASQVTLSLYPTTESLAVGETKSFDLKATFTGGSSTETIDYLRTEVNFSSDYLRMPDYVKTSFEGQVNFTKIFRVDGPQAANETGKIVIEMGAGTPGSGPSTNQPLTIARIYFEGKSQTPSVQNLSIGTTQVVNNQSSVILFTTTGATYMVGEGDGGGVKANLRLLADNTSPDVGGNFNVSVSLQLTNGDVKVSGADFVLLYDKNKLEVVKIEPATTSVHPANPFTDILISESGGSFDGEFNFLRVAQVANKPIGDLPSGTISLAEITFHARIRGFASIKYPEDNKYFQITGILP